MRTGHLTDIESFPVQSERYPQLSAKGAFCPSCVYTREDLTEVVDYGALRGVRILPEFDVPGHAGWAFGHPEITINSGPCSKWQPLDPTSDSTYTLLKEFLSEMAEIFTDPYLHLGGDEANFVDCFVGDKEKTAWMAAHNLSVGAPHTPSWDPLWKYFWERLFSDVLTKGTLAKKTISLWEAWDLSIFGGGAPVSSLPYDPGHTNVSGYYRPAKVETPADTLFNLCESALCRLSQTRA